MGNDASGYDKRVWLLVQGCWGGDCSGCGVQITAEAGAVVSVGGGGGGCWGGGRGEAHITRFQAVHTLQHLAPTCSSSITHTHTYSKGVIQRGE